MTEHLDDVTITKTNRLLEGADPTMEQATQTKSWTIEGVQFTGSAALCHSVVELASLYIPDVEALGIMHHPV